MMIRLLGVASGGPAVASQDRHRPRWYAIGHAGRPTPYRSSKTSFRQPDGVDTRAVGQS